MPNQPPILTVDPATRRVYIVTEYDTRGGALVAREQTDVTESFGNVALWLARNGGPALPPIL